MTQACIASAPSNHGFPSGGVVRINLLAYPAVIPIDLSQAIIIWLQS